MTPINKMKFIKLLFLVFLLIIPATSCDEWLELIPPDGLVMDEYWKTKEDLEATLMGAYQKFAGLDEKLFLYGELRADMVDEDKQTPNYYKDIMEGDIFPNNPLCNWSDFYKVINYCNNVLKYAPVIIEHDQTFTEYQMRGYEADLDLELPSAAVKSAVTIVTIGPIILLYPFLQRYFVKGVFVGSLKG